MNAPTSEAGAELERTMSPRFPPLPHPPCTRSIRCGVWSIGRWEFRQHGPVPAASLSRGVDPGFSCLSSRARAALRQAVVEHRDAERAERQLEQELENARDLQRELDSVNAAVIAASPASKGLEPDQQWAGLSSPTTRTRLRSRLHVLKEEERQLVARLETVRAEEKAILGQLRYKADRMEQRPQVHWHSDDTGSDSDGPPTGANNSDSPGDEAPYMGTAGGESFEDKLAEAAMSTLDAARKAEVARSIVQEDRQEDRSADVQEPAVNEDTSSDTGSDGARDSDSLDEVAFSDTAVAEEVVAENEDNEGSDDGSEDCRREREPAATAAAAAATISATTSRRAFNKTLETELLRDDRSPASDARHLDEDGKTTDGEQDNEKFISDEDSGDDSGDESEHSDKEAPFVFRVLWVPTAAFPDREASPVVSDSDSDSDEVEVTEVESELRFEDDRVTISRLIRRPSPAGRVNGVRLVGGGPVDAFTYPEINSWHLNQDIASFSFEIRSRRASGRFAVRTVECTPHQLQDALKHKIDRILAATRRGAPSTSLPHVHMLW